MDEVDALYAEIPFGVPRDPIAGKGGAVGIRRSVCMVLRLGSDLFFLKAAVSARSIDQETETAYRRRSQTMAIPTIGRAVFRL